MGHPVYVGETADNAFTRGRQHADALKNKSKDSVLHKHVRSVHRHDPPPVFNMSVTGTYGNDALPQLMPLNEGGCRLYQFLTFLDWF